MWKTLLVIFLQEADWRSTYHLIPFTVTKSVLKRTAVSGWHREQQSFYNDISHRHGWAHYVLWNQQNMYTLKFSKIIVINYSHNMVLLTGSQWGWHKTVPLIGSQWGRHKTQYLWWGVSEVGKTVPLTGSQWDRHKTVPLMGSQWDRHKIVPLMGSQTGTRQYLW